MKLNEWRIKGRKECEGKGEEREERDDKRGLGVKIESHLNT